MANPVDSIQNIQSNILAYEELKEYGFCRKQSVLDNTANKAKLGTVVSIAANGTVTPIAQAVVTAGTQTDIGIIIGFGKLGTAIKAEGVTAAETAMVLVNGTAIVRKEYLSVSEGAPTSADVLAKFVEDNMVQVKVYDSFDQFDGSYGDVVTPTE